jgi:hypothetical protein
LLHEYLGVTTIAFKDGTVYMQGDLVSTGEKCCCKCPLGECEITIEFLDENRCEDDVFDLYLKNPTTEVERFIQTVDLASTPAGGCGDPSAEYANIIIPVTVTETDFDETCNVIIGLRFVSANCCNTYARFRIRRPNGCLLFGQYFGQGGLETTYTWLDLCNDDPCPPPPPEPCCSKTTECENGTLINRCGSDSPQQCCSTYADDNDDAIDECSGEDPPVTSCEENGNTPANVAPYDCINDSFQGGAWVTVSGWSGYTVDRSGLAADSLASIVEAESKMNQAFFVPFDCLGYRQVTFDLGPGVLYDSVDCSGANYFVAVNVNLCARTASVQISHNGCFDLATAEISLGGLTAITVPCNSWTGCNCTGYSDNIPVVGLTGGGTITVSSP